MIARALCGLRRHAEPITHTFLTKLSAGGTTLLASLLGSASDLIAAHPGIRSVAAAEGGGAGPVTEEELHGEGIFLQDVYFKMTLDHPPSFRVKYHAALLVCGLLRRFINREALRRLEDQGWCQVHAGIQGYALSALPPPQEQARRAAVPLFSQWAAHWGDEWQALSKPILLEKSPSNVVMAPWLGDAWAAHGGRTRVIFITRHPLAYALAMQRSFVDKEASQGLRGLIQHWLAVEQHARRSARELLSRHPPTPVTLVSLERLAAAPAEVLRRMLDDLGVPPQPALFERCVAQVCGECVCVCVLACVCLCARRCRCPHSPCVTLTISPGSSGRGFRTAGPGQGFGLQAEHRSHCTATEQVRPRPNERYSETYRQSARLQAAHLELSREYGEQVIKAHLSIHLCLWYGCVCMHTCIRRIPRAGLKKPLSRSLSVRLPVRLSVFLCLAIALAFSRTLTNGASRSRRTGTICQRKWDLRFVTPRGCASGSGALETR